MVFQATEASGLGLPRYNNLRGEIIVKSTYSLIPTTQIDFDRENPRIKVALEKYGDKLDDQRIRFALQTATEGSASASSYRSLKDSIRAARGISVPIVVSPSMIDSCASTATPA